MRIILVVVGLLASEMVFSQNAGSAQRKVLTFEEAVKIALKNSMLLNQQKNNLEYSQIQKTSNYLGLGPNLSFSGSAVQIDGNTFNQQQGKVINGIFDQLSGQFNANINLFNGFSQLNRARQSSNLVEAQAYYVNRSAQDIIGSVSSAYLLVLLDGELLKIANENWEALKRQLEQVTEQVSLGAKAPVDQYNQNSQTKAAEIKALQAEINLINDRAALTLILLQDPAEEFEVVKPQWDTNKSTIEGVELQQLFDVSFRTRGDLLRAQKNEEAARLGMKSARAGMTPTLGAFGTLYSAYNNPHGDPSVRPFADQFQSDNLRKFYGLQLSIPILGGNQTFQYRTTYIQQKVAYQNSTLTRKNLEVQVKTDIVKAYQNLKLYSKTYAVSLEQLDAAKMAFDLEVERYNLGVTNFVDYINANRVFVQAQTDKAQAEYRLIFQKVVLDYAVGTLKPEDLQ